MNIASALEITGFMSEAELTYLATLASKCNWICEIGSWQGRSARAFAENTTGVLFCVDTWLDGGEAEFDLNLAGLGNMFKTKLDSRAAARMFERVGITFDLIFIDAAHDYENVKADILAWRPLLRANGILAGHDFYNPMWPEVKKAVKGTVPKFRVVDSIWTTEP